MRVALLGATGTIGRATARALVRAGHTVTCVVRPPRAGTQTGTQTGTRSGTATFPDAEICMADVTSAVALRDTIFRPGRFDAVVSCLASRTGAPDDAWAIDYAAHRAVLVAAEAAGVRQFVLLSAICVQKPQLAFQQAKLAFEAALQASSMIWSIVRPTAYFKSLSGQVRRVQQGKPFLLFGDGTLTACRPISDDDLGDYLTSCLTEPSRQHAVLPIGGPGPTLTLRAQGELLFALAGQPPRFRSVPVRLFDLLSAVLGTLGRVIPPVAAKAEFVRIGRYYATESMLVWDPVRQRYDADATPSFGSDTLADHYAKLLRGDVADDRGDHAVF